jgi:hypothetical protein
MPRKATSKVTFTLKHKTDDKMNPVYTYEGSDGSIVKFQSHPTKAWNYIIHEGDQKLANKVIEAYIEKGLAQHSYVGGFNEAIQKLEV